MGLFRSLGGTLRVQITTAASDILFEKLIGRGIVIHDAAFVDELNVEITILRKDYATLRKIADRRGEQIRLIRKSGIYWPVIRLCKRPIILNGLLFLFILGLYIPSRVFWIQIEGNDKIPDRMILQAAADSGIRFGASRREVRSEKMKNRLLELVPQLQWAGVNTYGCRAVISVRERSTGLTDQETTGINRIVAVRDGIIISTTVTKGTGLCVPGQAVYQGDTLISGFVDCGLSIRADGAEGEIFASTMQKLRAISPSQWLRRTGIQRETAKFSVIIGKKRINFFKDSGIYDATCVKMYSSYVLTLPGGLELPVSFVKESVRCFELVEEDRPENELSQELTAFAEHYLKSQMIAGSILQKAEYICARESVYILDGSYACEEMIGRVRPEQIGEYHGKND